MILDAALAQAAAEGSINKILIIISSSLILLLLMIIGFFIKRFLDKSERENSEREERQMRINEKQEAINKELNSTLKDLSLSIQGFNAIAIRWDERSENLTKNHEHLQKRYEEHLNALHNKP